MTATHDVSAPVSGLSATDLYSALGIDAGPSQLLEIDRTQVSKMAAHIRSNLGQLLVKPTAWDDEKFWNASDPAPRRSQFFAVGNSMNFRFWRLGRGQVCPVGGILDGKIYRGAMYMWRALRRELDRGDGRILDAQFLASLSGSEFQRIFADDHGVNPLSVAEDERLENLRDLGARLLADWEGQFFNLITSAEGDLVRYVQLCREFRAFDDPIVKLPMVNAIMHAGSGTCVFADEPLPGIDYHLLRQGLRQGLFLPSGRLDGLLKRGGLLSGGEALELRRLALLAFCALSDEAGLSGAIIDNLYWQNRIICSAEQPACVNPDTGLDCPFYASCPRSTVYGMPLELGRYY